MSSVWSADGGVNGTIDSLGVFTHPRRRLIPLCGILAPMARLNLRTRIQRRGDELVVPIPDYLHATHVREGDEVSVALRPEQARRRTRVRRPRA